jgi:adenosylhomocysteine nucleosidase
VSSPLKLAIVAALEREVQPLVHDWPVAVKQHAGRSFRFFENGDIVLVCGGIGAEPARRAAEAIIALYAPQIIYSAGFAGALDPGLKVADILVPLRVIDAGDCSSLETEMVQSGSGGGSPGEGSPRQGTLVTFGVIATPEQKVKLGRSFNAQAVDMEAAAVARAATARGVRFAAVKVISDEIDFQLPGMDQEKLVTLSGEFRTGRFVRFIFIRPWTWPAALRLARNSRRASLALCAWLKENQRVLLHSRESNSPEKGSPEISARL